MYDIVIIGAGLSGAVIAERFSNAGKKVLVVEKENHVGGLCFDYLTDKGNYVQEFGPHTFHTNDKEVYDYFNKFANLIPGILKCRAYIDDTLVDFPVNLKTIEYCCNISKNNLTKIITKNNLQNKNEFGEITLAQLESVLPRVSDIIYNKFYKNYTKKQWGFELKKNNVLNRLKIYTNNSRSYHFDKYSGFPSSGYTNTIKKMLKNCSILLNTQSDDVLKITEDHEIYLFKNKFKGIVIYTGRPDSFFNYSKGKLKFRKVKFIKEEVLLNDSENIRNEDYIVVNYPNNYEFTRITNFSKFPNAPKLKTKISIICKEYPSAENGIACYPIPNSTNQYEQDIKNLESFNIYFVGRIAEYKYYDMDDTIRSALDLSKKLLK